MNYTRRDNDDCRGDLMDTAKYSCKTRIKLFYFILFYFILFYLKQKPVHKDHTDEEDQNYYVINKTFLVTVLLFCGKLQIILYLSFRAS